MKNCSKTLGIISYNVCLLIIFQNVKIKGKFIKIKKWWKNWVTSCGKYFLIRHIVLYWTNKNSPLLGFIYFTNSLVKSCKFACNSSKSVLFSTWWVLGGIWCAESRCLKASHSRSIRFKLGYSACQFTRMIYFVLQVFWHQVCSMWPSIIIH